MLRWSVIEGVCQTQGAEGCPVFGVQTTLPDGRSWRWADVDADPTVAQALAARLQRLQPEECHFEDLIRDFIEEMAGKV